MDNDKHAYWVPPEERLDHDDESSVANPDPDPEERDISDLYDDPGEVVEEDLA